MTKKKDKIARKQFSFGDGEGYDFTTSEIENLTLRLALWFADPKCDRKFDNPEQAAKDIVRQCLLALTKEEKPWLNAPFEFAKRIKVKAAFDMEKGEGIPISSVKHPMASRSLDKTAAKSAQGIGGLNPSIADFDINEYRAHQEKTILIQYPELDSPVYLPHVRRLSLLYAQQEMMDRELIINPRRRSEILKEMEKLTTTVDAVLKTLDIHPDSLRKKIKENTDGTLGDLVARLDADDDFQNREKVWALQAALQFWYMASHPNGRGDGPQLEEWEVWHMTRSLPMSFTCKCGKHYPHLVRGFTPKMLKEYLLRQGVILEVPAIPKLMHEGDITGMGDYIDSLPEHEITDG